MLAYILLALFLVFGSLILTVNDRSVFKQNELCNIILFALFCLFLGLRSPTVGSDTVSYRESFFEITKYGLSLLHMELGFLYLNKIVALLGGEFHWLLIISAFIPLYFIRKSIIYFEVYNIFLAYFVLLCSSFLLIYLFSGIRQGIAMGIVLYGYKYVIERKFWHFLFSIFGASLFHFSAIVVIPIYWLTRKIPFGIVICGTICAFALAHIGITTSLFSLLVSLFTGHYASYADSFAGFGNSNTGLGIYVRIIVWLWIIYMLSNNTDSFKYLIIYNILSIGVISYSFCLGVDILIRLSEYFTLVLIIAIPYVLQKTNLRFNRFVFCIFIFIALGAILYSTLKFKDTGLIPYTLMR